MMGLFRQILDAMVPEPPKPVDRSQADRILEIAQELATARRHAADAGASAELLDELLYIHDDLMAAYTGCHVCKCSFINQLDITDRMLFANNTWRPF